jgi:hypothetical protein
MMVLVHTTVWIDFFAAHPLPHVEALERLIEQREDLCICGIILIPLSCDPLRFIEHYAEEVSQSESRWIV